MTKYCGKIMLIRGFVSTAIDECQFGPERKSLGPRNVAVKDVVGAEENDVSKEF